MAFETRITLINSISMKTLFLKHRILSILTLLVLTVSLSSCGNDDAIKSFLQKQADTSWKFAEATTGQTLYARINNSEVNPLDVWFSVIEQACFLHQKLSDDGTIEVLENSENELKLKVVDDGNPTEYGIFTLTVNGDILTVKSEFYEDDILQDQEVFILQKTSDDVDELDICPVPV